MEKDALSKHIRIAKVVTRAFRNIKRDDTRLPNGTCALDVKDINEIPLDDTLASFPIFFFFESSVHHYHKTAKLRFPRRRPGTAGASWVWVLAFLSAFKGVNLSLDREWIRDDVANTHLDKESSLQGIKRPKNLALFDPE